MTQERTEQPTQRKREDARRKGEGLGRSHEMTMTLTMAAAVLAAPSLLPAMVTTLSAGMRHALDVVAKPDQFSGGALVSAVGESISVIVGIMLPFMLLIAAAGVAGSLVSGGFVVAFSRIRPKASAMNPLSGFKRMLNKQAVVRMSIAVAKLAILGFVSYSVFAARAPELLGLAGGAPGEIASAAGNLVYSLAVVLLVMLAVIAAIDFTIQRRQAQGSLKMTRDEVRQEVKEQEGDPYVRAARRRRARQLAMTRMIKAVETADVVVTNPVHIAVALKYNAEADRAPKMVAKGKRLVAERIKAVARKHGVLVVEDVPLARALEPRPLGSEVPPHLYRAVANVLAAVFTSRLGRRA